MQTAAQAEETSETHDTLSPGPIGMTAHEALGMLLLELGRPGEALPDETLKWYVVWHVRPVSDTEWDVTDPGDDACWSADEATP